MTNGERLDPRTGRARRLRRDMTDAERVLWAHLRGLDLSPGHFRRQAPIGRYFADFAHHGRKLVIEIDGGQHALPDNEQRDAERTRVLESSGYRVLRFWNNDVLANVDCVVETIVAAAVSPPTPPPPHRKRGEGFSNGGLHSLPPRSGGEGQGGGCR